MDQVPEREDARRAPHGAARSPLNTGLRVFALGVAGGLLIVVAALVVLAPLSAGQTPRRRWSPTKISRSNGSRRRCGRRWCAGRHSSSRSSTTTRTACRRSRRPTSRPVRSSRRPRSTKPRRSRRCCGRGVSDNRRPDSTARRKSLTAAITGLSPDRIRQARSRPRSSHASRTPNAPRTRRVGARVDRSTRDVSLHTTTPDVAYVADRFRLARDDDHAARRPARAPVDRVRSGHGPARAHGAGSVRSSSRQQRLNLRVRAAAGVGARDDRATPCTASSAAPCAKTVPDLERRAADRRLEQRALPAGASAATTARISPKDAASSRRATARRRSAGTRWSSRRAKRSARARISRTARRVRARRCASR